MTATYALMILIGLVTYFAWKNPEWHRRLMLNPYATYYGNEYYRLLTSGFVHNSPMHLFLNLFTLFFFGRSIENIFLYLYGAPAGYLLFAGFFLTAIVVSDIPTFLKHKNEPNYNSLGASGGVSAFVLSFILFDPLQQLCLYGLLCLPGFILGALFIVYSVVQGKRGADNINHDAHLYGALYGAVFTVLLRPQVLSHFVRELSNFNLF